MASASLQLMKYCDGWQLLDAGTPVFWFPERDKALEIACTMADARNVCNGQATAVEAQCDDGSLELIASFG